MVVGCAKGPGGGRAVRYWLDWAETRWGASNADGGEGNCWDGDGSP